MKNDLKRNSFSLNMENSDTLVYGSIKLMKVFTFFLGGVKFDFSELYNFGT